MRPKGEIIYTVAQDRVIKALRDGAQISPSVNGGYVLHEIGCGPLTVNRRTVARFKREGIIVSLGPDKYAKYAYNWEREATEQ